MLGHADDGETHLKEALRLTMRILGRLRREGRKLDDEENALLHKIAASTILSRPGMAPRQASIAEPLSVSNSLPSIRRPSSADAAQSSISMFDPIMAQSLTADSPSRPSSSNNAQRALAKLKHVVAAQAVYKSMLSSKADLEALSRFAVECASTIKADVVAGIIAKEFKSINKDWKTSTFVLEADDRALVNPLKPEDAIPLIRKSPIARCATAKIPFDDAGTGYFPVLIENVFIAAVVVERLGTIDALDSARLMQMQATLSIAALSLRNAKLYEFAQWQTAKAEAMLAMANRLTRDNLDEQLLVRAITETAKQLAEADRCSVFIVHGRNLQAYFEGGKFITISGTAGIAGHVAQTGETVNIVEAYEDPRFNPAVDKATGYRTKTILCMPVYCEGTIVAVAQLINKLPSRTGTERVFASRDENVFKTFSPYIGVCLRNCNTNAQLLAEKRKSELVLEVAKMLSGSDIRDESAVEELVIRGAKKLLNADRSSLFLFDKEHDELYSKIADSTGGKVIRFPSGRGIAGAVAASGIAENIEDAYSDSRFNRDIDKQFGYRTVSILCEPITCKGQVLAVAQLVNKIDERDGSIQTFDAVDQATFQQFALFAGVSLNNAKMLEFAINAGREAMNLGEGRHRADSGLLRKGSRSFTLPIIPENELTAVRNVELLQFEDEMTSPNFNLFALREQQKDCALDTAAKLCVEIFLSTGLPQKFGCSENTLLNFVIQCRRRYRNVPYHNFYHAVDVCQTLHTFLYTGHVCELLTDLECYVLLAVALVHDLDHMGVNNSFHMKTDSPLGILSSATGNTSVLEVHHCNLAIEILEAANIFSGLSPGDQGIAVRGLIDCVLATDMARHGELLSLFSETAKIETYNKEDEHQRTMIMQMLTKAADISNVTKPFEVSRLWAVSVTEEFYQQGDKEKARGYAPLPMFDRSQNNALAKGQLGFINFVAKKFFETIVALMFPGMQWCLDNMRSNFVTWNDILAKVEEAKDN